jgi:POT family proton-dependent oligopeptide transporter
MSGATSHGATEKGFFGHPRGLMTLFFTEMWERFSYYGMRAILMLFMTAAVVDGGLGFDAAKAGPIYAMYTSMVYLSTVPGGWIADNVLGQRRSVFYGGIVIMIGHILLAMHGIAFFYAGLFAVVIGTGLLKPNISVIVGQLYTPEDQRRDAGFSIFYMGINIGAFTSPLVCGWLAQSQRFKEVLAGWGMDPMNSWHWGFGAAAVGMFFGLVQYLWTGSQLGSAGMVPTPPTSPAHAASRRRTLRVSLVTAVASIGGLTALAITRPELMSQDNINFGFTTLLLVIVVGFFAKLFLASEWTRAERARLVTIFVLFCGAAIFWGLFEQAGSTLTLFADESTSNSIFGWEFPSSWWQSVNAIFIIFLAPFFAALWPRMGKREPSYPAKFAVGLLFAGLGFAVLVGGALAAKGGVRVSPMWLLMVYLLHTIGELCLSPVGLSSMTKLAPVRVVSLMMGVWFLAASVGNFIAGRVSGYYEAFELPTLLGVVAATGGVMAFIMFLLVGPIRRMMERSVDPAPVAHGH